jgi:hypothetical protein
MELIGGETRTPYLQTFIAQSNHGSRGTSSAIQSNHDVHVCDPKYGLSGYVVEMMVDVRYKWKMKG